jgi:hypothetical protein
MSVRRDFQWARIWEAPVWDGRLGRSVLRERVETVTLADRDLAVRMHADHCRGGWVTATMVRPHVSGLYEWHTPDDLEARPAMSRRTCAGQIKHGADLYDLAPDRPAGEAAAQLEEVRA